MNLQVPPELGSETDPARGETGRTADQVALDLLASSVDHDEWFRGEVEKGRTAAREGRLIDHDDVAARRIALSPLMRVRWTADAADDLERIGDYIAEDRPDSARRVAQSGDRGHRHIGDVSEPGPRRSCSRHARDRVSSAPFVAIYEIREKQIVVLRILHGAQSWPSAR